jgi:VIT1/CCC1 family predicted Fe2+/Mn2+ transporter
MEWVLAAAGAGLMLGWSIVEVTIPDPDGERSPLYKGSNALAAFVGGMLFLWSFALAERFWSTAALTLAGALLGAFIAIACEALRFIAEINEEGR